MIIPIKKYIPYFLCIPVLGFLIMEALGNGDFKVFLEAAKLVGAGKTPYHQWIFISEGNYAYYYYSPLWAVILIPFSHLPNFFSNLTWLLANTWFLYRIWILLTKFIDLQNLSKKQITWLLFLCILLNARFILYNFGMIQMTIFLLWGAMESLRLIRIKKFLFGGMLLALVINIKVLPILLIPYLIYRKELKGTLSTLFFSLLFLFLPCLVLGWSTNLHLLSDWWRVINPDNAEHLLEPEIGPHSLTALIPALLMKTVGTLPFSRNIFNLDLFTTTCILNAVRIGLFLFTFYFLRWSPFRHAKSGFHEIYELSYIFLLIPLIFPHQQKYAFFLASPALFYISWFIITNYRPATRATTKTRYFIIILLLFLSFVLMTLSSDGIIGRYLNQITQHYKTITYGALLLIVVLILCSPMHIEKRKLK
ncbi:MAG: glycosyltransferase family 87 protein [Bacteroidetes bacterium]|nr:glycosyltransferase family 87 protein [Bacteroidota bacterium]